MSTHLHIGRQDHSLPEPDGAVDTGSVPEPWNVAEEVRVQFRGICTFLRAPGRESLTIGVTSTVTGEGVSWVASLLACALAEDGQTVHLVDAARSAPAQLDRFGLAGKSGLAVGSDGPVTLMAAPSGWRRLSVLSIRTPSDTSSERLTAGLAAILCKFRVGAAVTVVDCEAARTSSQALGLRDVLDGVLYVVQMERERREVIAKAQAGLQQGGVPILGVVLNQRRRYIPEAIYRAL